MSGDKGETLEEVVEAFRETQDRDAIKDIAEQLVVMGAERRMPPVPRPRTNVWKEPDPEIVALLPEEFPSLVPTGFVEGSPKPKRAPGHWSWNRRVAAAVLERIMNGETMRTIGADQGMPSRSNWRQWCLQLPILQRLNTEARRLAAGAMFEEALEAARRNADSPVNEVKNSAERLRVETLKWAASRLDPREYGDKGTGGPGITIKIVTNLDVDDEAVARVVDGGEMESLDMEEQEGVYTVKASVPASSAPTLTEADRRGNASQGARRPSTRTRKIKSREISDGSKAEEGQDSGGRDVGGGRVEGHGGVDSVDGEGEDRGIGRARIRDGGDVVEGG